jgi:hypothetical protein
MPGGFLFLKARISDINEVVLNRADNRCPGYGGGGIETMHMSILGCLGQILCKLLAYMKGDL